MTDVDATPADARGPNRHLLDRYPPLLLAGFVLLALPPYVMGDWVPADEGLLGQTAERVLRGELPHRDFDDPYTGALAMLHAGAFRVLGISVLTTRWTLWGACWIFAALLYGLARRRVGPAVAALVAVVGLSLGVARYFASMPSWYNALAALACLAALLRWRSTGALRWLALAGAAAGVSMTVKIIGIYLVPAVLLAILHAEWLDARGRGGRGMFAFKAVGLAAFVAALLRLIAFRADPADLAQFVLPSATIAGALLWWEWRTPRGPLRDRLAPLVRHGVVFALGLAVPLILFAIPYGDALPDLLHGVLVAPFKRLDGVTSPLPPLFASALLGLPVGALLIGTVTERIPDRWDRRLALAFAIVSIGAIALARRPMVYQAILLSMAQVLPWAVLAAVLRGRDRFDAVAAAGVASLFALVQLPYWHPINAAYAAPAVVLLVLLVVAGRPGLPWRTWLTVAAGSAAVGMIVLAPAADGPSRALFVPAAERAPAVLGLPRAAGIAVSVDEKRIYEQVVADIAAHSAPGAAIWAGPDSPEIYFLSARRNPTRTFYEIFEDPVTFGPRLLATLDAQDVEVIVLNRDPEFSSLAPALVAELGARFPNSVDREWYEVRWRAR